jgi:hypothetical protein
MVHASSEWAADPSELGWLQARLAEGSGDGVHVVAEVVPAGFDRYVRVFHSWFAEEDEQLRSTWRERAAQCGVPYAEDLTVRALRPVLGPTASTTTWMIDEGEPDSLTRAAMVEILAGVTGEQQVFFAYELAAAIAGEGGPLVLRAPLAQLESIRDCLTSEWGSAVGPEHWWPEDRSWVVGSDYDLCSTYIACSHETGRLLLTAHGLEAIGAALDTRVDEGPR